MKRIYVKKFYPGQSFLPVLSMDDVVNAVSEYTGRPVNKIMDRGRTQGYSDARYVAAVLMYELIPTTTWNSIKDYFGWKTHASVYQAIHQVEDVRELRKLKREVMTELTGK